jgi:AcrR family transcriptional regulator
VEKQPNRGRAARDGRPTKRDKSAKSSAAGRNKPSREILTTALLDKAAVLFAAQGYAGTSLQDIADEIGLSRPSIYHYFPSKEALLEQLVRDVTLPVTTIFDTLDGIESPSVLEKIRDVARRLVLWVTNPSMHFTLIERAENELPPQIAAPHRAAKRRVLDGMVKLIEAGIRAGEVRAVNPRIAAFAILGMCNWTASWFSPKGALSTEEVAQQIAELAVASVRRTDKSGTSVQSITGGIRESLDLIDRLSHTSAR